MCYFAVEYRKLIAIVYVLVQTFVTNIDRVTVSYRLIDMIQKQFALFFIIVVVGVVTIVFWMSSKNLYVLKTNALTTSATQFLPHQNDSQQKTILMLYWGYPWNLKSYVPPEGLTSDGCEVTHSRDRIKEADFVIFHYTTISSRDMPWKHYRNPDQIFVWWSAENPAVLGTIHENWDAFDNFFNWTYSYRRDSEALYNYGNRANAIGLKRGKKAVDDIIASKKKLAIWIVSQCDYTAGARRRMAFANELRKAGLNFDGHGRCFPDSPPIPRSDGELMVKSIREHKFYFAFENGQHCKDYITEKFWHKSLALNAVPIVWGPTKEDLLSVAPLDSFVFAEDYESPQKLAEYIKFLDEHDNEYRKYFRWREDENMTDAKMIAMTKERYPNLTIQEPPKSLCKTLHEKKERKIIKSLKADFMESNPKECTE